MSRFAHLEAGPAVFSEDQKYRYILWRVWDPSLFGHKGEVAFIGLNPSTADEAQLDPTLRRCADYAERWGYGMVTMLNLFAYRATNPHDMAAADDPVGPENDAHITIAIKRAKMVVACWGVHGTYQGRDKEIVRLARLEGVRLHYLRLTKDGIPCHPLYLPNTLTPIPLESR